MKKLLALIIGVCLAVSAHASEIVRGTTLVDGSLLYASDLHSLVDTATVGVQFYNDAQTTTTIGAGYYFLVLDPVNQVYRRVTGTTALYGNTNLFLNQSPVSTASNWVQFLIYDPTNNVMRTLNLSNLFIAGAHWLSVSNLSFASSNVQYLPLWSGAFAFTNTNQPSILVWDTNGVPYYEPLSNFEKSVAADFGAVSNLWWITNNTLTFKPYLLYGTNSPTNIWGTTNFPITSLLAGTNTNNTLLDADTVPLNSGQQSTNTSATLLSLYQYMTNKNALPAYTQARIQFNGNTSTYTVTNVSTVTNCLVGFSNNGANPLAVSFLFTAGSATQIPSAPTLESNAIYYAVNVSGLPSTARLYTNWSDASAQTNWVTFTGSLGATKPVLYTVTNFTSYNADVIQAVAGTAIATGFYEVWFRTNSAGTNYYVTGNVQRNNSSAGNANFTGWLNISNPTNNALGGIVTTSNFYVETDSANNTQAVYQKVYVLVNPE